MDRPIVRYLNEYIIKSINSLDFIEARNVKLALYVDWIGETYNFRELWVWSANIIKVDIN